MSLGDPIICLSPLYISLGALLKTRTLYNYYTLIILLSIANLILLHVSSDLNDSIFWNLLISLQFIVNKYSRFLKLILPLIFQPCQSS